MYRVGMIGLGQMGLPIARNLVERGFEVAGYRRHASPDLAAAGGIPVASAAAAAEHADVLLSILPGASDVEEVVCGPDGTLAAMRPGTVHIEMSTIDVERKRGVADAVRQRGGDLLDCPISGSPGMVAPRLATTFASGDPASVGQVTAVLDAISGPWVYTGAFGTGARLKYIANLLLAVHTVAAAEAMVLARHSGLDLELVQRTLDSSIGASAIWKQRGPVMRDRTWSPAPGPIDTLAPILEQIEEYAAGAGVPTPVFTSAKAVFDGAVRDGWGHLDIASVHDQVAGLRPDDPRPGVSAPASGPPAAAEAAS
jgi:putative dehydrogenase